MRIARDITELVGRTPLFQDPESKLSVLPL